jgi:hypothetical protein
MGLCLAYQLADRGGDGSPSCSRIRLPSEKRPFTILLPPTLFCCLPHFTENRDNEGPALRARTFYAQQITSYPREESVC